MMLVTKWAGIQSKCSLLIMSIITIEMKKEKKRFTEVCTSFNFYDYVTVVTYEIERKKSRI